METDTRVDRLRCMGQARRVIRDYSVKTMIELGAGAEYMQTYLAVEKIMTDMEQRLIDAVQPVPLADMMPQEVPA